MTNDRSYYMRRAAQERSAAVNAAGDEARGAHQELARRYRRLVKANCEAAKEPASGSGARA
jgi:hypothetical protein